MKFSKLLKMSLAAAVFLVTTIAPVTSFAQSSGLGWDDYTRILWRGSDQHVALWVVDPNLNFLEASQYGPYAGWYPVALTSGNNSESYLLWRTIDGDAALWILDANLNYITGATTGANPGWTPESLSMGTSSTNLRLVWRRYDGAAALWSLTSDMNYLGGEVYGPYFGYDPGPAPEGTLHGVVPAGKTIAMPSARSRTHEQSIKYMQAVVRAAKLMSSGNARSTFPHLPLGKAASGDGIPVQAPRPTSRAQ